MSDVYDSKLIGEPDPQNNLPSQRRDTPALESKQPSQMAADDQFRVLQGWWRADRTHSANWRQWCTNWMKFRAGDQWSVEDKQLLNSQDRPHIVFNRALTVLKAVAGMEINGRHEIQFIPRGTEDTKANELLSAASKWMSDGCDAEDEESQAFEDVGTCGMGWTENRMSYEDDPAGMYVEEKLDPREMYWDRKAKKKNLTDAKRMFRVRRMSYADALLMFPGKTKVELDAVWARGGDDDVTPQKTLEERRIRDPNTTEADMLSDSNEVTIVHAQWVEMEPYWRVADEENGEIHDLTELEYRTMKRYLLLKGMELQFDAVRMTRRRFKQAFLGGLGMLQKAGPPPVEGRFSWTCITGEYDAGTGTWFGLVKIMEDPQRWANKWMSQVLHILNTAAKGGWFAENDAFDDERQGEESLAFTDRITYLAKGALSGDKPKIIPKNSNPDVKGFADLMSFAVSSIKDVTGINLELLGQQDQNQPGVVEAMRKQAGMTVLATMFDSLRRFRKQVGRCRLFFIQTYLSDGRLIRVAGPELAEAVPLVKDKTVGEYDVVIDDAPTSPNQKEANWAVIAPLIGVFKEQLMGNPILLAEILAYSPLPSRLVDLIKQFAMEAKNDPKAQAEQQQMKQLQMRALTATVSKDEGAALKSQADAALSGAKAKLMEIEGLYKMAMADNMLSDNKRAEVEAAMAPILAMAEAQVSQAEAQKKGAETTLLRMQAIRERIAAMDESEAGRSFAENEAAESRGRQAESAAKTLLDMAKAHTERQKGHTERMRSLTEARKSETEGARAEAELASAHREYEGAETDRIKAKQPRAKTNA